MATSVTIQKSNRAKGMQALYLDFHPPVRDKDTMKLVHKKMLGVKIYKDPSTKFQKQFNKEIMEKVEAIKAKYILKFINEDYSFLDNKSMKGDFLDYFSTLCLKKKSDKWKMVFKHFYNFVYGECTFNDVTPQLCEKFKTYLLEEARSLRDESKPLSQNSCAGYYGTFMAMLKIAYQEKRIKEDVCKFLKGVKWIDPQKDYLTIEELKNLANTPCEIDVLKRASIFSCFTGLRISDILNLRWENISPMPDGQSYCMRITTQKTRHRATLPISDEALEWCGERSTGLVFKGLNRVMIYAPLKKWVADAGIDKHITFHCLSHIANYYYLKINTLPLILR